MFPVFCVTGAVVETVKVVDVAPAGIVTVAGTVAEVVVEASVTLSPPVGAGVAIVTVAVEGLPPVTTAGLSDRDDIAGGAIVSVAEPVWPLDDALIVDVVLAATAVVETVNVVEVNPAGTTTEAGVVALLLLDDRVTV